MAAKNYAGKIFEAKMNPKGVEKLEHRAIVIQEALNLSWDAAILLVVLCDINDGVQDLLDEREKDDISDAGE